MDFSFQEFHIHRFPNECFSFQELQNLRSSDRRSSDDDFTLDGIVAKRAGVHPWVNEFIHQELEKFATCTTWTQSLRIWGSVHPPPPLSRFGNLGGLLQISLNLVGQYLEIWESGNSWLHPFYVCMRNGTVAVVKILYFCRYIYCTLLY